MFDADWRRPEADGLGNHAVMIQISVWNNDNNKVRGQAAFSSQRPSVSQ